MSEQTEYHDGRWGGTFKPESRAYWDGVRDKERAESNQNNNNSVGSSSSPKDWDNAPLSYKIGAILFIVMIIAASSG